MINRAIRELDRERSALEREEKKLIIDIKKMAKEQQMGAVKIMAKVGQNSIFTLRLGRMFLRVFLTLKRLSFLAKVGSSDNLIIFFALVWYFRFHFIFIFWLHQDLVRTRAHVTKFIEMRSHLQSCGLKLQTVKSHQAMADAMKSTTSAMVSL